MSIQSESELKTELRKPKNYSVHMLNDDYTTWEFCIKIITAVFNKTVQEADTITHEIHTKGRGFCGIYSFEIAETKADTVQKQACKLGFPMKCFVEEV